MAMEQKPLFFKPAEAAIELRCGKSKIYDLINSGEIPSTVIGGMLRVPRRAIEALAANAIAEPDRR